VDQDATDSGDPAVAAADRVISGGEPKQLEELLVHAVREGLHAHVARLKKELPPADDVAAGRRWVAAYVPFVHWAEGVHAAAAGRDKHGSERAALGATEHAGHQTDHDAVQKAAAADFGHHDHR
jgi:hypothetical protein